MRAGARGAGRGTRRGVATRIVLGAVALSLGVMAAVVRPALDTARLANEIENESDHVTALELAEWIRDRKPGLRVLDVRTDSEYAAYHIPSAEHVPLGAIATLRPRTGETLVLYSEGGAHAAQGWVLLRAAGFERVYFLRGGLLDWTEDVMSPVGADARAAALSRYFGGVPRAAGAGGDVRPAAARSAVERVRRRGC